MKSQPKEKRWWAGKLFISLVLLAFIIFVVVVMFINSVKPSRITLIELDGNVKGAAFIKTNQALIE